MCYGELTNYLSILGFWQPKSPWLMPLDALRSMCVEVGRFCIAKQYPDRQLSELASALGTLEMKAGKVRHSKRLFRSALMDPTDNTVAQVFWATRTVPELSFDVSGTSSHDSYEATAWNQVFSRKMGRIA